MLLYTLMFRPLEGTPVNKNLARIYTVNGAYSLGLAIAGVMLTFMALERELQLGSIALLSSLSAVTQMGARLPLGWALRYITDKTVMLAALATLAASMAAALALPGLAGLAVAQLLQGTSRAGFWSASQTHVIRSSPNPVKSLSRSTFITSSCSIAGPFLAGWLAQFNVALAAWATIGVALAGLAAAALLRRLPVFSPPATGGDGKVRHRPGVVAASAGSLVGGAWHVTLTTFAPVVLAGAGWTEAQIGGAVSGANASLLIGTIACAHLRSQHFLAGLTGGACLSALGIACLGLADLAPGAAVAVLIASGAGTGFLLALGPAIASVSVHPEERGAAVVVTGSYRAGALLAVPLAVSGAITVLPATLTLGILGVLVGLPSVSVAAKAWLRAR
ncbi:MAG: MFS transporter [Bifidobacteriaceae bacterium]|jgi:hypothetical protein|nr:MFS transporter [Bifidobacteriaceae bacterium]